MLRSLKGNDAIALAILLLQTVLVAWMSCLHSPNIDEPAHLASGVAHWELGNFEFYRVNPPLIRAVAALPTFLASPKTDYSGWSVSPYSRSEFSIGSKFMEVNSDRIHLFFVLARWICLPILFAGGWIVYLWAKQLYSPVCGLIAVSLYGLSPNMLAYGASITPDMGAASFGIIAAYAFWQWLQVPTWRRTILAGMTLGLAELTKSTWILLFGLWPCLCLLWISTHRATAEMEASRISFRKLASILCIALYLINLGFSFEGSFKQLKDYTFISETLSGRHHSEKHPDNRFKEHPLGSLPIALPENYVRGIDVQKYDFEVGKWSFANGEHKYGGWWWYYLYALVVKEPVGNLILMGVAFLFTFCNVVKRDELVLLAPAIAVFLLVSSQTGFNRYVRYILPCMPFFYIWISKVGLALHSSKSLRNCLILGCLVWSITSSLWIMPHSMSYFNELTGGPRGGGLHLLDANIDWAQDFHYLKKMDRSESGSSTFGYRSFWREILQSRTCWTGERSSTPWSY